MDEIERKYIARLRECAMTQPDESMHIRQGYVYAGEYAEWRIRRIIPLIKTPRHSYEPFTTAFKFGNGFVRKEYEWEIPEWLFKLLGKLVPRWLRKSRLGYGDWSIDRFYGDLAPLVLVEIEQTAEQWA